MVGSYTLPTTNDRMITIGARLTVYEVAAFTTRGFADFVIQLQRNGGTWTISTDTDTAVLDRLPTGFHCGSAVVSGALEIQAHPAANNAHAVVEFWVGTTHTQVT